MSKKEKQIKENRDFKGVWIPKEIWLNDELGWSEKVLLVELESLDNEIGCYASNEYLGNFFGLSKDRISKMISKLKEKGFINVSLIYKEGTKQVDKRFIKVDKIKFHGIGENNDTYSLKQLEGIGENNHRGIGENNEDNNTVINNTVNNTIIKDNAQQVELVSEIELHFEKFWNTYNKKVDKSTAKKSFEKVMKKHSIEQIMEHTLSYLEYVQVRYGSIDFQKYPSTFLNRFNLEDDFKGEVAKIKSNGYNGNNGKVKQDQSALQIIIGQQREAYENATNEQTIDRPLISQNSNTLF